MKNKIPVLLLAVTLSFFTVTAAHAGGGGGPHHHHHGFGGPVFFPSVSFVIGDSAPAPSPYVTLVGHVYRQVSDDTYLFTDGRSTFQLDSDDSHLPMGSRIVVRGRFDGDAEINVHHWNYAE